MNRKPKSPMPKRGTHLRELTTTELGAIAGGVKQSVIRDNIGEERDY